MVDIERFVQKTGIPWPLVYGAGITSKANGDPGLPSIVVIEPSGKVLTNSDITGHDPNKYLEDLIYNYIDQHN
jgi:hypothetical protein